MIRRPPRSTQGVSSAASDVYKRQPLISDGSLPFTSDTTNSNGLGGAAAGRLKRLMLILEAFASLQTSQTHCFVSLNKRSLQSPFFTILRIDFGSQCARRRCASDSGIRVAMPLKHENFSHSQEASPAVYEHTHAPPHPEEDEGACGAVSTNGAQQQFPVR